MKWITVEQEDVRPGDVADHVAGNLDPREVAKVDGDLVWLHLTWTTVASGPYPLANYTYQRKVER